MKVNKLLIAVLSVVMLGIVACKEKNAPSGPGQQEEKPTDTTTVVIPENVDIPANAITVAEAREICAGLESGATTGDKYYVKGWVKKLHSKHASGVADYGNAQFYMVDKIGDTDDFMAYQVYGLNGQKLTSADQVEVGDYVVVYGELTNYNGTYETVGKGAAYIYSSSNTKLNDGGDGPVNPDLENDGTLEHPYTVADVRTLNNSQSGSFWVEGFIVGVVDGKSLADGAKFEAAAVETNLIIADNADAAAVEDVIPVQLPTGFLREALNLSANPANLKKKVAIYGSLEAYFGVAGVKSVTAAYLDGTEVVKPADEEMGATTIANFLAAEKSTSVWYELTGVITDEGLGADQKFDMDKYGDFMLQDETGSVYVYGIAPEKGGKFTTEMGLKKGMKITLKGLRSEYKGVAQVGSAYLVEILDGGDDNGGDNGDDNGDDNGGDNGGESTDNVTASFTTAAQMPTGWTMILEGVTKDAAEGDFYKDFSFKLNKLNKGVQSPKFDGGEAVKVSFVISKLNEKKDVTDPSDGMFDIYALDADGNVLVSNSVSGVNAEGTYSAELQIAGSQIAAVQVVMTAFPHNGKVQCNAALKEVVIEKIANE